MRFEKLTENKIRITFNLEELKEKNIDLHSFMANSEETQDLFLDMLKEAEREIGFTTKDYKIMIEALATYDGHFVLTVTRSLPEGLKTSQKKLRVKRKTMQASMSCMIYAFSNFEDFCSLCDCLEDTFLKKVNQSFYKTTLYFYKNSYHLVIKPKETCDPLLIKKFYSTISEFSTSMHCSEVLEKKLMEYGSMIIKDKALQKIKKYFVS